MVLAEDNPIGQSFLLALAVTVGMQMLCFVVAATIKFDKITDLAGSTNVRASNASKTSPPTFLASRRPSSRSQFVVVAVMTLLLAPYPLSSRQIVVTALVCLTRLEVCTYVRAPVLTGEPEVKVTCSIDCPID